MSATVLGGIEIALEDTIVDYIRSWITDDHFKVKKTVRDTSYSDPEASEWEYGPASVHAGMLPRNEVGVVLVDQIPVYPFVLCHITKGKDAMPQGLVFTKIIVGVWDNNTDYQGYRDAVALLRKIVRQIWYWNTLAETYQIEMDEGSEWRVYDSNEVTWPFFLAEAIFGWRLRTPIMKAESEDLDYTPPPTIVPGSQEMNIPVWQPSTGITPYE
jgi:hypothetical protein